MGLDRALQEALRKAYTERAKLFVEGLVRRDVSHHISYLAETDFSGLTWSPSALGISQSALAKVKSAAVPPHFVFCHPDVLRDRPGTMDYYRNLAALSAKGLGQMVAGTSRTDRISEQVRVVNAITSGLVEAMDGFDLQKARAVIPAEIGTELQGTWVNRIGQGAAKEVRRIFEEYINARGILDSSEPVRLPKKKGSKRRSGREIRLTNGWTIVFGSEPDVAIRDPQAILRAAIEIKGSLDVNGAQTRYGEAKKSFAKALKEHAQCETIYLASCFTTAVNEQIRQDAFVRKVFNLVEILANEQKREMFVEEIFVHLIRVPGKARSHRR